MPHPGGEFGVAGGMDFPRTGFTMLPSGREFVPPESAQPRGNRGEVRPVWPAVGPAGPARPAYQQQKDPPARMSRVGRDAVEHSSTTTPSEDTDVTASSFARSRRRG